MQDQFYVSHDGKESGPFTVDVIVQKLNSKELQIEDYYYDEVKGDWTLLLENPLILAAYKEVKKPKSAPQTEQAANVTHLQTAATTPHKGQVDPYTNAEWFILKGENRFGPFTYPDLLKMLQEKALFEFDFVWYEGMSSWQRVAELPEFHVEKIRSFKSSNNAELSEVFFRRRHARVAFGGSLIVHDNKRIWKGQSLEVSQGGAGVIMANAMATPGQIVYLHFKAGDNVPAFNAECEIVNKQYVKGVKSEDTPIKYGLRFVNVNQEGIDFIKEFAKKAS